MPQPRLCPKCPHTPLAAKTAKAIALDECGRCGGRWYDLGELVRSVARPEKLRDLMAKGPLKPKPGDALCPACGGHMVNGGLVNALLRADMCPQCRGFWLDQNEIGLVDRLLASL